MSSSLLLIYPAYSPFMGSIMKSSLGRLVWRCQESWLGGPAAASSLAVLACVECCRRIPAACVGTARRALRAMFRKTRLKLNVQVAWCAARLFLRTARALCQDAAFIVNPSKRLNLRMCRSKSRLCRHQLAWPLQSPSLENLRLPHCLRQQIPRQIRLQPCGSA